MFFWAIFSFVALVVYYPQAKNGRFFRIKKKAHKKINLFINLTTWKITLFMGFQSFLAYSLFFWYVQIVVEKGFDRIFYKYGFICLTCCSSSVSFWPFTFRKIKTKFTYFLHSRFVQYVCDRFWYAPYF